MTILLAQKLVVGLSVKVFLCTGGFTLMQSDDVVFLPHFITVDGTESRGETAVCREEEDGCILDTVVWFAGKSGTQLTVDDAGAAVGWREISGGYGMRGRGTQAASSGIGETIPESVEPATTGAGTTLCCFQLIRSGTAILVDGLNNHLFSLETHIHHMGISPQKRWVGPF